MDADRKEVDRSRECDNSNAPQSFSAADGHSQLQQGIILEQDRFLPIANISRIMKRMIPHEGKLSKEAKECVQECITEFILFITSESSERCAMEKRKTISGEDLLLAFRTLGFDEYVEPLENFLQKYREANKLQTSQMTNAMTNPIDHENGDTDGNSTEPVIYLQEQQLVTTSSLHPVQVFYDAANGQYFIPVQDGNGSSSLWHVNLSSTSEENTNQN